MNDLLSVIVPIYNMEHLVEKCIKSIINQTYKELEIILVDDGSIDNSYSICKKYEKKDKRVTLYHKSNGGLSDAKNYGISKATGKYITFVDSDDWIESNMYEIMMNQIKIKQSDMAICGRFIDFENGKSIRWYHNAELEMDNEQALLYLNSFYNFDMASWDKVYLKSLFDGIKFPFKKKCEDAYTTYKLFSKAKKIIYIPECLYHYYQRTGSISRNKELNLDYIYAAKEQMDYIEKYYPDISFSGKTAYVFAIKSIYQVSIERKIKINEEFKKLKKESKKYIKDVFHNKYIGIKKKVTFTLFAYFSPVYRVILKIKYLFG